MADLTPDAAGDRAAAISQLVRDIKVQISRIDAQLDERSEEVEPDLMERWRAERDGSRAALETAEHLAALERDAH